MKSIKSKLVIYFCALIILVSGTIGGFSFWLASNGMKTMEAELLNKKITGDINVATYYMQQFYGDISFSEGNLVDENGKNIGDSFKMVDRILMILEMLLQYLLKVEMISREYQQILKMKMVKELLVQI
ncbi:hypothetical protein [Clostridium sp. C2-6-12]|uniref:hypothetical protein n=1 Tax=Clostridium sp. C2-6-12 TaxID=2698832 RepID=UPI00136866B6|nr:hypothetical protein [Clostridium sp. C2-6-12]